MGWRMSRDWIFVIGILAIALAIAGAVVGVEEGEEILQLETNLISQGYGWLINYSGDDGMNLNTLNKVSVYLYGGKYDM